MMYKRRLKVFLALMAAGEAVLIGRLVQLQLVQGEMHRRQAESLLVSAELLPTVRGRILDRQGRVLAYDEACFDFCLHYRLLKGPGSTAAEKSEYDRWVRREIARIAQEEGVSAQVVEQSFPQRIQRTWILAEQITGAARDEMARAADEVVRRVEMIRDIVGGPVREETLHHPIVTGLSEQTKVALQAELGRMVGSSVRPSHRRCYPFKDLACHVIGLLGPVTPEALARASGGDGRRLEDRLSDYLAGDRMGICGVERLCETLPHPEADGVEEIGLRGRRGYRLVHRTHGLLEEVPAEPGRDVHLTLDVELQRRLAAELARPGAIVVLDVPTGEVLAMVSLPTFDPNEYRREFSRLLADTADLPLLNKAVGVRYVPASTLKPLAALAGLKTGEITPRTTFTCRGYLNSPDAFRCWIWDYHTGHGTLEVVGALEHSCNVFFYNVGERVGLRRLNGFLAEVGYDDLPGTHLPEERRGLLPDPRGADAVGEARFLAIGQGKISVTPMHVAGAMAAIARGGEFRTPLLVDELASRQRVRRLGVAPELVALVQEGMFRVVNSPDGTAYKHAHDPEVQICGKTGTGEAPPRREGIDDDGDGRIDRFGAVVRSGDMAWFAGYAPRGSPRIAIAVLVEYSSEGGARTCGPIARQAVRICRELGYL